MRIRKQVYELTPEDLDTYPAWQFALDEEGAPDQDEATVRPMDVPVDPDQGMCVAKAEFTLNDGTVLSGFFSPTIPDMPKLFEYEGDDGSSDMQPSIVTQDGHVAFWYGMLKPTPEVIAESYRILGRKSPEQVFPIKYQSVVEITTGDVTGELQGFMYLVNEKRGLFRRKRVVRFVVE
jgi:hypothetical protein